MGKKREYKKIYDGDVLRLAKKRPKGVLRIVFSRFPVVLLMLLLQLFVMTYLMVWLEDYQPIVYMFNTAFSFLMLFYLFASDMDSAAKLVWLFFMALFPYPTAVFLLYTRMDFGNRRTKRRVAELIEESREDIRQPEGVLEKLDDGTGIDDLTRWLNRTGCYPVYDDSEVTYFPSGEKQFESLLEELRKAEKYIFLESFIIEEGYMWGRILEILIDKAKAGVDVRVIYDGMCEISLLPWDYCERLQSFGIQARTFGKIRPILSSQYNYRDHRKIVVIDGTIAYNGGINMADEYIGRVERFGVWKDAGLMIRGNAAKSFALMFLQMWSIDGKSDDFPKFLEADTARAPGADGFVIPYGDCPVDADKVGKTVYADMLNRASDYVHIMTPYLILDDELEFALKFAAQRGVDVRLILPGIPDKKPAYALAKSYYRTLTEAGVKIYEYSPGFVHAKTFVCDGTRAVVGTINLDYRSLYHHYECATYLYRTAAIGDIEKDFRETMEQCREVTDRSICKEKFGYQVLGVLMRFVAPLM